MRRTRRSVPLRAGFSPAAAASDVTYTYCDARTQGDSACVKIPVTAENHNLDYDTDPKFVDAENGDCRLAAGSPLIDAGGPANTWESWMGTGSRRSVQDVGNGCFEVSPVGTWGVRVARTETVPRRCGTAIDMGGIVTDEWREYAFSFVPTVDLDATLDVRGAMGEKTQYDDFRLTGGELVNGDCSTMAGWTRPKGLPENSTADLTPPFGLVNGTLVANHDVITLQTVRVKKGLRVELRFRARAFPGAGAAH